MKNKIYLVGSMGSGKSSIGRLVTRTVNDMETIASIFSQGLFMIVADLILMFSVLTVMVILSVKLSLIIF